MKKIFITLLILSSFSAIGINKYTFEKLILLNSGMSLGTSDFLYVDQNNHKYLSNTFGGIISFGNNNLVSPANNSIFIVQYDQNDTYVNSQILAYGNSIVSSSLKEYEGNLFLMISYRDKIYFGSDSLVSAGKCDIAILKFDMNYSLITKFNIGSAIDESCPKDAFTIADNQIYLGGNVNGDDTSSQFGNYSLIIGNDTLHIDTDTFHSHGDYFISKFDLNLQPILSKSMGGRQHNSCLSLRANQNHVYLLAYSSYNNNNEVGGTQFNFTTYSHSKYYIAKLNPEFNSIWFRRISNNGFGYIQIKKMELGNNIILFSGYSTQGSGCGAVDQVSLLMDNAPSIGNQEFTFVCTYDTNGVYKWNKLNQEFVTFYYSKVRNKFLYTANYYNNSIIGNDTVGACSGSDAYIGEMNLDNGQMKYLANLCGDRQDIIKNITENVQNKVFTSGIIYSGVIDLQHSIIYPDLGMNNMFYSSLDSLEYFPLHVSTKEKNFNMNIYPNPCHQTLNVKLPEHSTEKVSYTLYDITGRQIELSRIQEVNSTTSRIYLGDLQKGNYFLRVNAANDVFTKMFSVE